MKKHLILCTLFGIIFILSCEKNAMVVSEATNEHSAARESIDSDFLNFELTKYFDPKTKVQPLWSQATKLQGNMLEVPFQINGTSTSPSIKERGSNKGVQSLLFYKKGKDVYVDLIAYFPNADFKGDKTKLNVHNYKAQKFSGLFLFHKLITGAVYAREFSKGDITKKWSGMVKKNGKSARFLETCEQWGMFADHYDENGTLLYSVLLFTFWVCEGGDEDQGGDAGGGNWSEPGNPTNNNPPCDQGAGAQGQQMVYNVQNHFAGIIAFPGGTLIHSQLAGCNIWGILSQPLGPVGASSSYNVSTGVLGVCMFGNFTPTTNSIQNISTPTPCGNNQGVVSVQSLHQGNINISIAGSIATGPATYGGALTLNMSVGVPLSWLRSGSLN